MKSTAHKEKKGSRKNVLGQFLRLNVCKERCTVIGDRWEAISIAGENWDLLTAGKENITREVSNLRRGKEMKGVEQRGVGTDYFIPKIIASEGRTGSSGTLQLKRGVPGGVWGVFWKWRIQRGLTGHLKRTGQNPGHLCYQHPPFLRAPGIGIS